VTTKNGKSDGNIMFMHILIPFKAASKLCLGLNAIEAMNTITKRTLMRDFVYNLIKNSFLLNLLKINQRIKMQAVERILCIIRQDPFLNILSFIYIKECSYICSKRCKSICQNSVTNGKLLPYDKYV